MKIDRARIYSAEERDNLSVALNQPHRQGNDGIMYGSALGRFCLRYWNDEGTRREYWDTGERYAQLVDRERIATGLHPRQKAEVWTYSSTMSLNDQIAFREEAREHLQYAEDAIREVDIGTVRLVRQLAYDDRDLLAWQEGRARNGLYKLKVYFERKDKPKHAALTEAPKAC